MKHLLPSQKMTGKEDLEDQYINNEGLLDEGQEIVMYLVGGGDGSVTGSRADSGNEQNNCTNFETRGLT
jgi:hypothetical protein